MALFSVAYGWRSFGSVARKPKPRSTATRRANDGTAVWQSSDWSAGSVGLVFLQWLFGRLFREISQIHDSVLMDPKYTNGSLFCCHRFSGDDLTRLGSDSSQRLLSGLLLFSRLLILISRIDNRLIRFRATLVSHGL